MSVVLPNDTLTAQFPQASIMVATRRHQIRTVRTEGAVPHPALVTVQGGLEGKGSRVALSCGWQLVPWLEVVWRGGVEGPDACGVVGAAGCEVSDVGRQQHACDVSAVGGEFAYGDNGRGVVALDHSPDIYISL
jgi:hypothetical protein